MTIFFDQIILDTRVAIVSSKVRYSIYLNFKYNK